MVTSTEHRTRDDLLAEQQELLDAINSIKTQIADAKARAASTGDYSDRNWYSRATFALKKKQQRYQMLMHEIGEMNRKARRVQSESFGEEVIRSCKRLLDKETFAMVMDDAHRSHARAVAALDEAVL